MAATKSKKEPIPEPAPEPGDLGELNSFVLYSAGGVWRSYMDEGGNQAFTRRRALRLADFLRTTNPKGWGKVEVASTARK